MGITNLVVNICNVHDKVDVQLKVMHQDAPNDIGRHIVPRMAKMAEVVYSRSADIPGHLSFFPSHEGYRGARLQRVMNYDLGSHDARV
jgi:hypothetical protein